MKESPIFIKSFETLQWMLERTRKFPAHQRFVMARRIEDAGLSFHDSLVWATKAPDSAGALFDADFHLERLRVYNRLCMKLKLLSFDQYEFLARQLDELGPVAVRRQRRKMAAIERALANGQMSVREAEASLRAWDAHGAQGTTWKLRRAVLEGCSWACTVNPASAAIAP